MILIGAVLHVQQGECHTVDVHTPHETAVNVSVFVWAT